MTLPNKIRIEIESKHPLPQFPEGWYKHCPKATEADHWQKHFDLIGTDKEIDPKDYAECAFTKAGHGMQCENCSIFLRRPFLGDKVEEEYLPKIEKFYEDVREAEANRERALQEAEALWKEVESEKGSSI